jgi:hypothetical protein
MKLTGLAFKAVANSKNGSLNMETGDRLSGQSEWCLSEGAT